MKRILRYHSWYDINTKENLTKAIEIYRECGADGWMEKAEEEMAELL